MAKNYLPIHYKIENIMEIVETFENAFGTMSNAQLAKLDLKPLDTLEKGLDEMEKGVNVALTRWEIKKIIAETEDFAFLQKRKARQRVEQLKEYREDLKELKIRANRLVRTVKSAKKTQLGKPKLGT